MPSIYFIDSQSGTNIETTGGSAEKDKLLQSIEKALEYQPINTAAAVADRLVFIGSAWNNQNHFLYFL